jgi:hypothetical protein
MKKGTVIPIAISHKNLKHVFKHGETVTENDVNNFDLLVKQGKIAVIKATPKVEQTKVEKPKEVEAKKEDKSSSTKEINPK